MLICTQTDEDFKNIIFDANEYFTDMIGVSKPETEIPIKIKIWFSPLQAKYVFSKPIHTSLTKIRNTKTGTTAEIFVKPNYELYQWLLSMGEHVKVLSPKEIQTNLIKKLNANLVMYQS